MNRERSPSVDGERKSRPRWDSPTGQLPGAGVPSGVDSGLYGIARRPELLFSVVFRNLFHLFQQ